MRIKTQAYKRTITKSEQRDREMHARRYNKQHERHLSVLSLLPPSSHAPTYLKPVPNQAPSIKPSKKAPRRHKKRVHLQQPSTSSLEGSCYIQQHCRSAAGKGITTSLFSYSPDQDKKRLHQMPPQPTASLIVLPMFESLTYTQI